MKSVILADKRTASTYLQHALDSHPDILCLDEMFMYSGRAKKRAGVQLYKTMQEKRSFSIRQYLEWIYGLNQEKTVCFRLMYNQDKKYGNIINILKDLNISIIHLIRKNQLKRVFSRWTANELDPTPREINPEHLYNEIKESKKRVDNYKKILKKYNNYIEIEMKQLFGRTEGELNNVEKHFAFNLTSDQITYLNEETNELLCNFLNVEKYEMRSNISKKNKLEIWDYITNKSEVIKFFKQKKSVNWLEE